MNLSVGPRLRAAVPWLIAGAAYGALTLAFLWPIVRGVSSGWPHDPYDPALNGVILAWDARSMPLTQAWWNAPIFWPAHGALALSEHLLGIALLTTPLQWLGASPLTAYNVAFIVAFPLTALAAHALAFALVRRHDVAAIAGCIFGFSPYRVAHFAHIQMMWVFGMPLALMALHRFVDTGRRRWLMVFGCGWLMQAAANGYFIFFFPVLLVAWVLWFARDVRIVAMIAATWVISTLPLAPVLWGFSQIHTAMGLRRSITEIQSLSADITAVFAASPDSLLWHTLSRWARPEGELFPGLLAIALVATAVALAVARFRPPSGDGSRAWRVATITTTALAGGCVAIALSVPMLGPWKWTVGSLTIVSVAATDKPLSVACFLFACAIGTTRTFRDVWRRRSIFWFYVFAAAAMLVFSFGPRPTLAGTPVLFRAPYAWLMRLPGFSEVRVPARFGMLFVLCLSVAAALAFARVTATMKASLRQALAGLAIAIVVFEGWPHVTMAAPAPPIAALRGVLDRAPVLELPLGAVEGDAAAEYRALEHGHPNVNGYSGYEARHYQTLKIGLLMDDRGMLDELARDQDIIVAVNHRDQFERWARLVGPRPVIADDGNWRLYRIAAGTGPPLRSGSRLHIQSVTASLHNETVGRMLDDDLDTAWTTGRVQRGDESLELDLGGLHDVSGVGMTLGSFTLDFPRVLSVDCSVDGQRWNTCWRGSAPALAMRAVIDAPLTVPLWVPVAANGVRYIRLRQGGADAIKYWTIAELTVFGT